MPAPVRMPVSGIPDLQSFKRHLWQFRDETGESPLSSPSPWIFHYIAEDDDDGEEMGVLQPFIETLRESFSYDQRLRIEAQPFESYVVNFADIEVLHAFLVLLMCQTRRSKVADEIVRFIMRQLGFLPSWR